MRDLITRRNIIIAVIFAILIIILAIVLLTPQDTGKNPNDRSGNPATTPISATTPAPQNLTYKEFLKSGRSEICTFSVQANNQTSSGTVYAANGKIRGDFSIPMANGTVQQHMLIDSYMAYLWTNASANGVKFTVQDTDPTQITKNTAFNCSDWSPNVSVFEIPANITFTEISSPDTTPALAPIN